MDSHYASQHDILVNQVDFPPKYYQMTLLEFDCQRTSFKNGKKAFDSTQEGEGGGRKPVCNVVMQGWRRGPSSHVKNIEIKKLEVSQ